jgi:hypothetical protein
MDGIEGVREEAFILALLPVIEEINHNILHYNWAKLVGRDQY